MTKVIELYAGPGSGKSTTAAGLFYKLKLAGINAELVTEYVKSWAWNGRKVGEFDQIYLLGKQLKSQSDLYGKVDYIITDSPILLCPMYEKRNLGNSGLFDTVKDHYTRAERNGVEFKRFFLQRNKEYIQKGRYENEIQAREMDVLIFENLITNGYDFETVNVPIAETVDKISNLMGI